MNTSIHLGRLVESEPTRFIYFCDAEGFANSHIGAMVAVDQPEGGFICGIVSGQHWASDEMAARLAQIRELDPAIAEDQRWLRTAGPAVECRIVGMSGEEVRHSLPTHAIAALVPVRLCSDEETISFMRKGWMYLRLLISRPTNPAIAEVLAAHIQMVNQMIQPIEPLWADGAARYLIRCLSSRPEELVVLLESLQEGIWDE